MKLNVVKSLYPHIYKHIMLIKNVQNALNVFVDELLISDRTTDREGFDTRAISELLDLREDNTKKNNVDIIHDESISYEPYSRREVLYLLAELHVNDVPMMTIKEKMRKTFPKLNEQHIWNMMIKFLN